MAKRSQVVGNVIALLIAAGVITTLLVVLMTDNGSSQNDQEPGSGESNEDVGQETDQLEGDFVYTKTGLENFNFRGKMTEGGSAIFAGIPFAEPPVGEFRWQKTIPASSLSYDGSYYDATFARPGCPQICDLPSPEYVCPSELSEDCLHLSVYVPTKLTKRVSTREGYYYMLVDGVESQKTPVMVFFYGGAYIAGGNGVTLYDARFIAEKGDVVMVVVNYRLGPFGFFYQNQNITEPALGSFGIWDQIESLKWVNKNIAHFGGDPSQVTIFGQSAGAQSVAVHLVNSYSDPLFHRAILESNPFGLTYKTMAEAQVLGDNFAEFLGCSANNMSCLRALSMEKILEGLHDFPIGCQYNKESLSQIFEPWSPVLDNDLLSQHPYYSFKEGSNQKKPLMHGTTTDEGMYFIAQALPDESTDNQTYDLVLRALFGKTNASKVKEHYPPKCPSNTGNCDNREVMDDLVTDYMFTCPSRHVFNTPDRIGDSGLEVWWYTFDQPWSFPEFWDNYTECYNLTCHAAELPYLFDSDKLLDGFSFTDEETILANKMIYYWTNFAKFASPNPPTRNYRRTRFIHEISQRLASTSYPPDATYWPSVYEGSSTDAVTYKTMKLTASGEEVLNNFHAYECDFWDDYDVYLEDSVKLLDGNFTKPFEDNFALTCLRSI